MKVIYKTRVMTRNVLSDLLAVIVNLFGGRLKNYEKMLEVGIAECMAELPEGTHDIKLELSPITKGAVIVVVYGVLDD